MGNVQKIILHIGMAKSGSTALQHAFRARARTLLEKGVLYPEVRSSQVSHKFLSLLVRSDDELPGHFQNLHGGSDSRKSDVVAKDLELIRRQIKRHKPHTLLLSTEHLFNAFTCGRGEEVKKVLAEFSDTIEIVAYLRRPSSYYLSETQQSLQNSARMMVPAPVNYQDVLEMCASLFASVNVRPFEREQMSGRDVVADFFSHFLPGVEFSPSETSEVVNEALSAESSAVLQNYHRINHAGLRWQKSLDVRRLISYVRFVEQQYGLRARPKLLPGVEYYLDHASTDLLWLRDRFDVSFSGIDYGAVGSLPNPFSAVSKISEVCHVDSERYEAIQLRILRILLSPRIPLTFPLLMWVLGLRRRGFVALARKILGFEA